MDLFIIFQQPSFHYKEISHFQLVALKWTDPYCNPSTLAGK